MSNYSSKPERDNDPRIDRHNCTVHDYNDHPEFRDNQRDSIRPAPRGEQKQQRASGRKSYEYERQGYHNY